MTTIEAHAERETLLGRLFVLGAQAQAHGSRTLDAHLAGTYDILLRWGAAPSTCVAGMFHSVYGTNAFRHRCLSGDERGTLEGFIGTDAERLVYLFSVSDRPAALIQALSYGGDAPTLVHRVTGEAIAVTRDELHELLAIECANLLEQRATAGFLEKIVGLCDEQRIALVGRAAARDLVSHVHPEAP